MSDVTGIRLGSLVLGSRNPGRLNAWYRAAFAPHAGPGSVVEFDTGRLIFDQRADVSAGSVEPGRILINLYVGDIRAVAAHLTGLDVAFIRPVEAFGPGLIATVADCDGNYVQIIELSRR